MSNVKAAFISFGFFAYPTEFIKDKSIQIYQETRNRGLEVEYFGPVIEVEESNRIVTELKTKEFDFIIAHTTTWTTSPVVLTVLKEFRHVPVLVWGIGGKTENGTLISPASAAGTSGFLYTLKQFGIKYKYIYDHPDSEPKYKEVLKFAKIVETVKNLNGARVGAMGYCDMGLYSLMIDGVALKKHLGMDVEDIFSAEIDKAATDALKEEIDKVVQEMKDDLRFDSGPTYEQLEKTARLTYALRKKAKERNYLGITMKCVYGVSRYMGFTPCLTQALLAKDITSICESDTPGLITNVILKQLAGQSATFLENYEYYEDKALVGVCGFAPFDMTCSGRVKCMNAGWGGFTGLYVTEELKPGKITVARLSSEEGRLRMLLLTADAEIPGKWAELGWAEPMPKFPSMLLKFNCPLDFYIENIPAQHINFVYGDYTREVREFCRLTGIDLVEYANT
jgi:L-fucose isomerase and related proteins